MSNLFEALREEGRTVDGPGGGGPKDGATEAGSALVEGQEGGAVSAIPTSSQAPTEHQHPVAETHYDEKINELDTLRQFTIPKKKKAKKGM